MKKVVILCPYPYGQAPSQRFRFEQYLVHLERNGNKITFLPFYNQPTWQLLYKKGNRIKRWLFVCRAFAGRLTDVVKSVSADFVFIHREILPIGPPVLEWVIASVFGKRIIYDFDDAIWMTDKKDENRFEKTLRWRSKVGTICKMSYKVSCGNRYLADYALQFNTRVFHNPTTIDTELLHNITTLEKSNRKGQSNQVVIGWTGSHSTLKYLEQLGNVLEEIQRKYPTVSYLIIADRPPQLPVNNLLFKKWSKATEIEDLARADIGLMPLPDDEWAKGKCGFKALQYLALEIPAVVSPVGVNTSIVTPWVDGFLCSTDKEWVEALSLLIEDANLRKKMGVEGRKKVESHFSVQSNTVNFLSLFS